MTDKQMTMVLTIYNRLKAIPEAPPTLGRKREMG